MDFLNTGETRESRRSKLEIQKEMTRVLKKRQPDPYVQPNERTTWYYGRLAVYLSACYFLYLLSMAYLEKYQPYSGQNRTFKLLNPELAIGSLVYFTALFTILELTYTIYQHMYVI